MVLHDLGGVGVVTCGGDGFDNGVRSEKKARGRSGSGNGMRKESSNKWYSN